MKSNGPTRRDKFAEAWAKLEDITKKGREGREGREGRRKCLWLVFMTAF